VGREVREPTEALVSLPELNTIGEDLYQGESPDDPSGRLYGGQVTAQALRAAGLTVPGGRSPHSLHGYFLIDQRSPVARHGRGLAVSDVFTRDGELVAGVAQEGLLR
jgi:acyl-CoA thioesterase